MERFWVLAETLERLGKQAREQPKKDSSEFMRGYYLGKGSAYHASLLKLVELLRDLRITEEVKKGD